MDLSTNKFEGKYLGSLGQFFGIESAIKIDEIDCWLNRSRNVTLILNEGKNEIYCSQKLSDIIREFNLDEKTDELKKYSVYEFADGAKYVTHLVENISIDSEKNLSFGAKKEDCESIIINEGEIISIRGEELSSIILVEKKIYQEYLFDKPHLKNKSAGCPYWKFNYKNLVFYCSSSSFIIDFENTDLFELQLIRKGKYIDIYSYITNKQLASIAEFELLESKHKFVIDKYKFLTEVINNPDLSFSEKLELIRENKINP
jgi:hypothetical protein